MRKNEQPTYPHATNLLNYYKSNDIPGQVANALPQPWAMVIHPKNAGPTFSAVTTPWWLPEIG
jgi:hypothetical protein